MADPVSIISLGLEVVKGIIWYYKGLENFTEDVTGTSQSLQTLQRSLELIQPYLEDEKIRSETRHQIRSCVEQSDASIKKLEAKLKKIRVTDKPDSGNALSGMIRGQALKALYPFKRSTLAKLNELAVESQGQLHLALTMLGVDQTSSVSKDLSRMMSDNKLTQVLQWLPSIPFHAIKDDLSQTIAPETGVLFLSSPEFLAWKRAETSTLYCHGLAGAGKTMISCIAAKNLEDELQQRDQHAVCYLFCNYKLLKDGLVRRLLASTLSQLLRQLGYCPDIVEQTRNKHMQEGSPSTAEYVAMLRVVLSLFARTYLVIDALDEYNDGNSSVSEFLASIFDLQSTDSLSVMVTTRPIPEISAQFQKARKLEILAASEDMEKYLRSQRHRLVEKVRSNETLVQDIQNAILKASSGLFLLAKLHMEFVIDATTTPSKARRALRELPSGLQAFDYYYHETMDRIQKQRGARKQLAMRALCWMSFSLRRLSMTELLHALAIDENHADNPSDGFANEDLNDDDVPEIDLVITVCAGLLRVNNLKRGEGVEFAHYTVQEFFHKYRDKWFPSGHSLLCKACVSYLSCEGFVKGGEWYQDKRSLLQDYAAEYWGTHAKLCHYKDCREITLNFLKDERRCASTRLLVIRGAVQSSAFALQRWYVRTETPLGLVLATFFGLHEMVESLFCSNENLKGRPSMLLVLLPLATIKGHLETIKVLMSLLDLRVAFNTLASKQQFASNHGAEFIEEIMKAGANYSAWSSLEFLLAHEQVRAIPHSGRSMTLRRAAREGRCDTVRNLLEENPSELARTACLLSSAASSGHVILVKMLLEFGADLHTDGEGARAIMKACEANSLEVVQCLLNFGVEIPFSGPLALETMIAACKGGIIPIVDALCDGGADINKALPGRKLGATPMEIAIVNCQTEVVQLLLNRKASIAVCSIRLSEIVRATTTSKTMYQFPRIRQAETRAALTDLLQRSLESTRLDNLVQFALLLGRTDYVTMMLDQGGDVNTYGGCFGHLLQVASRLGQSEMVQLLLERGSDVNAPAGPYGTALQAAISRGDAEVEKMLREHGASE